MYELMLLRQSISVKRFPLELLRISASDASAPTICEPTYYLRHCCQKFCGFVAHHKFQRKWPREWTKLSNNHVITCYKKIMVPAKEAISWHLFP